MVVAEYLPDRYLATLMIIFYDPSCLKYSRPGHPEPILPSWFPYFGLSYILGSIVLVVTVSQRISRNASQEVSNLILRVLAA